jgi:hypothetical protein
MIRSISIAFVVIACTTATAQSTTNNSKEPKVFREGGAAPILAIVSGIKDGQIMLKVHTYKEVQEEREVEVDVPVKEGGKTVTKKEKVKQMVTGMKLEWIDLPANVKDIRCFNTEAKPIDSEKVPGLFRNPTVILLSTGDEIDPKFLKIAKESTPLVVVISWPKQ